MIKAIEKLRRKEPFVPFRIITTSGEHYDVVNPNLIAIGQSELFYYYPRSEQFAFIKLNQIVSLESIKNAA
jgi:hypothetical protein